MASQCWFIWKVGSSYNFCKVRETDSFYTRDSYAVFKESADFFDNVQPRVPEWTSKINKKEIDKIPEIYETLNDGDGMILEVYDSGNYSIMAEDDFIVLRKLVNFNAE